MENTQDISSGKTCREHSLPTKAKTSKPSLSQSAVSRQPTLLFLDRRAGNGITLGRSWQKVSQLPGGCLMRSFGECPREEDVSTLSQILQRGVPEKYYLSQKACQGILKRASARGKQLPEMLKLALERQARSA